MAKYFKGYDADARRRLLEQYRQGTGTRNLPRLTDPIFADEQGYSQEVRYNAEGELEARFYKPKNTDETPVRQPFMAVNPETGEEELQYNALDFDSVGPDNARPAALTIVPTSSTNYKRPYTVAAGWERYPRQSGASSDNLGTLTVLFRDGTLWNYYDVDRSFWVKFRTSISKGEFIAKDLPSADLTRNYRNGPADVSRVSEQNRQLIYTIARASQYRFSTKRAYKYTNKATGERRTVKPGAVPKSAQKKLGKNPNQK
jgi:hypothetical protein